MTALQLLSQLREKGARLWAENGNLRVQAPLGTLTEDLHRALAQRKEEILRFLKQASAGVQNDAAPPIKPVRRDGGLPLSFAQQRLWFLQQLTPGSTAYHVRLHYRLKGLLNRYALEQSLNEIVRRHESIRTTFATVDGSPVQIIAPPYETRQPLVDLSGLATLSREAEARRLAGPGRDRPFDLSAGPLLSSILLKLGQVLKTTYGCSTCITSSRMVGLWACSAMRP